MRSKSACPCLHRVLGLSLPLLLLSYGVFGQEDGDASNESSDMPVRRSSSPPPAAARTGEAETQPLVEIPSNISPIQVWIPFVAL